MERLSIAVLLLREIKKIEKPNYSMTEFTSLLDKLNIEYKTERDGEDSVNLSLDFDEDLNYSFCGIHMYRISLYKLYSRLVSKLNIYYNEIDRTNSKDRICKDRFMSDVEELLVGKRDQIGINELIIRKSAEYYNDDRLVALLMFFKDLGPESHSKISYIEVVDCSATLYETKEVMELNMFDKNMDLFLTVDYHTLEIKGNLFDRIMDVYEYQKQLNN